MLDELKFITATPDFVFSYNKFGDTLLVEVKSTTKLCFNTLPSPIKIQVWISMDAHNCSKGLIIIYITSKHPKSKEYLIKKYKSFSIKKKSTLFYRKTR